MYLSNLSSQAGLATVTHVLLLSLLLVCRAVAQGRWLEGLHLGGRGVRGACRARQPSGPTTLFSRRVADLRGRAGRQAEQGSGFRACWGRQAGFSATSHTHTHAYTSNMSVCSKVSTRRHYVAHHCFYFGNATISKRVQQPAGGSDTIYFYLYVCQILAFPNMCSAQPCVCN